MQVGLHQSIIIHCWVLGLKFLTGKCLYLWFSRMWVWTHTSIFLMAIWLHNPSHTWTWVFQWTGRWNSTVKIRNVAVKAESIATNVLKTIVNCSANFIHSLLVLDIRLILKFTSLIWNFSFGGQINMMEEVQCRYTKKVLGVTTLYYNESLLALEVYYVRDKLLRNDFILCFHIFHPLSQCHFTIWHIHDGHWCWYKITYI